MEQNQENTNRTNENKTVDYSQINMFDSQNNGEQPLENNEKEYYENDKVRISEIKSNVENENKTALDANGNLPAINNRDEAVKFLEAKGLNYSELEKEFSETGTISKESREKLLQMGISNEFTDNYIEGQKARMNAELDEISMCIGGRDNFNSIVKWAAHNLSQDEIKSINTIHDKNVMKIILKELKTRMNEKEGITPKYIKGEGNGVTSDVFRSKAEMFEAINNPKYRKDEQYRKDVRRKINNSINNGVDLGL